MMAELRARAWQLGTFGVGAIALLLAALLTVQTFKLERSRVTAARAETQLTLVQRDLGTCSGNVSALSGSLGRQNAAVAELKADSDARLAAAENIAQAARKSTLAAEVASARIKAKPPIGSDICVRMQSADETFLEAIR